MLKALIFFITDSRFFHEFVKYICKHYTIAPNFIGSYQSDTFMRKGDFYYDQKFQNVPFFSVPHSNLFPDLRYTDAFSEIWKQACLTFF